MADIVELKSKYDKELRDFLVDYLKRFEEDIGLTPHMFEIRMLDDTTLGYMAEKNRRHYVLAECRAVVDL